MTRRTTAHLFCSANGVVESPNLWQFDAFGPEEGELMGRAISNVTDMVIGRKLWQEWSEYWPAADGNDPFARFVNPLRKHVISTTLSGELGWNSSLIADDAAATRGQCHHKRRQRRTHLLTAHMRSHMEPDQLDLYRRSSSWTADLVGSATDLTPTTPCDEWTVRDLLNHMLDTQRFFLGRARGEDVAPPAPNPPDLLSDTPRKDFERMQSQVIDTFSQDGVIDKTGPALSIAFCDQLLHGCDLARATGQDDAMRSEERRVGKEGRLRGSRTE